MASADVVLRRVRALCQAMPETAETESWGHPNFKAGKRTFAAFEWIDGRPSLALRLAPADVNLLLGRRNFFATPYGRGQWASVWADTRLDWRLIERLLERSYRLVALNRMLAILDAPRHSASGAKRSKRS